MPRPIPVSDGGETCETSYHHQYTPAQCDATGEVSRADILRNGINRQLHQHIRYKKYQKNKGLQTCQYTATERIRLTVHILSRSLDQGPPTFCGFIISQFIVCSKEQQQLKGAYPAMEVEPRLVLSIRHMPMRSPTPVTSRRSTL